MSLSSLNFLTIAASFVLSLALTPLVRAMARRFGIVAKPKIDRWHKRPTAMLGGVAIWLSVIISYLAFVPYTPIGWRIILASISLPSRTRRRSRTYQALSEVDRSDNGFGLCYLLWLEFAVDQFLFAEYSADDLLVDWDYQCVEFTR